MRTAGHSKPATRPRAAAARRRPAAFYRGEKYLVDDSVGYLIKLAHASIVRALDRQLVDFDLTAVQVLPLMGIADGRVRTAAELARLANCDPGGVTRMLDRLEAKELVTRTRSPEDRRIVQLALTPAGRRIAERIPYLLSEVLNEHLGGFTRAEFEQFRDLLRRFLASGAVAEEGATR